MSNVQQLPIGVFDSGVGGLSVLKVLQEQFPNEDFIYIGDNANNPVGNRSDDEITYLACHIAEALACKIDGYCLQYVYCCSP